MSLIGFIFLLVFVLFAVYIGIKLVPIYLNHMSVVSEVKAIAGRARLGEPTAEFAAP